MIFLLTYDRSNGTLVSEAHYRDDEIDSANEARLEAEIDCAATGNMEVVILKSESREKLQKTHARYFKTLKQLSPT